MIVNRMRGGKLVSIWANGEIEVRSAAGSDLKKYSCGGAISGPAIVSADGSTVAVGQRNEATVWRIQNDDMKVKAKCFFQSFQTSIIAEYINIWARGPLWSVAYLRGQFCQPMDEVIIFSTGAELSKVVCVNNALILECTCLRSTIANLKLPKNFLHFFCCSSSAVLYGGNAEFYKNAAKVDIYTISWN